MSERYVYNIAVTTAATEDAQRYLTRVKQQMRTALRRRVFTQKTPLRQFIEEVFGGE